MRVLAIETSLPTGSVALCDGERCVIEDVFRETRNHAAELAPRVRALLDATGGLAAIDGYAISIGPGSFTGLRIGVSFLKGLAAAHPRPAVSVSTLQVMAVQALSEAPGAACVAILDARRGEVFAGLYAADGNPDRRLADGLYPASDLARCLATVGAESVGTEWLAVGDQVLALAPPWRWASPASAVPRASTVGRLAAPLLRAGQGTDAGQLDPAYHQRSAAEVNLGVRARDDAGLNLTSIGDEVDPTHGRT